MKQRDDVDEIRDNMKNLILNTIAVILFSVCIITLIGCSYYQTGSDTIHNSDTVSAPNSIYGEIGGQGLFLSANYDRMLFDTKPHNIALRAGLGLYLDKFFYRYKTGLTIPLNISYLFGGNHKFELGVGYTLVPNNPLRHKIVYSYDGYGRFARILGSITTPGFITSIIGYRYQALDGGFVFRFDIALFFADEGKIFGSGGLSFGYAF